MEAGLLITNFKTGKYLTFRAARHDFAMSAGCVKGILPWHDLQPVDPEPFLSRKERVRYLLGYASMQGIEFPVIDLPGKLHLAPGSRGRSPCIVVIEIETPEGPYWMGFVADVVSDVLTFRERDFRHGKLRAGGRPRAVLDIIRILRPEIPVFSHVPAGAA